MNRLRNWGALAALLAGLAALLFAARGALPVELVEAKTLDWRFGRFADPAQAHPDIVLAMLDQKSLDYFEEQEVYWPWPRSLYSAVLEFCRHAGAKAVVFDILFTSPSPYGHEEDANFAASMRQGPPALLAMELNAAAQPRRAAPPPARFALGLKSAPGAASRAARLPVPVLTEAAAALGDVRASPDPDGVSRRVPLLAAMGGRIYPSLSLAAATAAAGAVLEHTDGALRFNGRRVPLIDGRMLVRFRGASLTQRGQAPYKSYSLGNIILSQQSLESGAAPALDPGLFKDKIVFVGLSAGGLLDNRPSPVSEIFPGTEILAAATNTLLSGDFLVPAGGLAAFLLLAFAVLGGACAALLARRLPLALAVLAALSLSFAGGAVLAFRRGLWLDMALPQLALLAGFAAAAAYSYLIEGRKRAYIKRAFGHYLSPEVVERIADDPARLELGGEKRELTLFFSDIEGFTSFSEKLEPDQLVRLINRYLGAMTDILLASGGTLDKYVGDAIMAFWGAPADQDDHAERACRAALTAQKRLAELRVEFAREGLPVVRSRIGLNTGTASVGNLGSAERFDYTAMGDAVNLASRLEGANKAYGTYLMISESVRARVDGLIETRELDMLQVKGKGKSIRVFELLGFKGEVETERLALRDRFEQGLAAYRARRFDEAALIFASLPDDPAAAVFALRCRKYSASAPPEDWDGAYAMTEK